MPNSAGTGLAAQGLRAATVAAALCLVALITSTPVSSNDFWLQVTVGGMVWNDGALPDTVLFAFTEARDYPFHAHEWLVSVFFYLAHEVLGFDRLLWLKGALGLLLFALCVRLAHRLTSNLYVALFLGIVTMIVANYRHFLRPELFACLYLVVLLNLLAEYQLRRQWKLLLWTVPLALAWANSHGSFPLALVIVGCVGAGAGADAALAMSNATARARAREAAGAVRPYAACGLAMLLAMLVNPYGYNLFLFAMNFSGWEITRQYIIEWGSTFSAQFMRVRGFWAYLALLGLCLAVLVRFRRRVRAGDVLLLAAFGWLSSDRQRHIVWFAFVALYVLARVIGPVTLTGAAMRRAGALLFALLAAGIGAAWHYGNMQVQYPYSVPSRKFTPELIDYVESRSLQGNVFNSFELGAELVHKFYPRLRPVIDSRIDAYGEPYFRYYTELYSDERLMLDFISHYDVRYMLLLWWEFEQIRRMRLRETGWRMIYADHRMVLLGRDPVRTGPAARQ